MELEQADQDPQLPQTPSTTHLPSVHDTEFRLEPGQDFPPFLGAGLLQLLDLDFVHLLSHDVQDVQVPQFPLITHLPSVHDSDSRLLPGQTFPPFCGAGLSHFLVLDFWQLL